MKADPGSPKRHFRDDICSACYHVMKKMAAERCDYEAIEDGIKLPQWKAGQLMRVAEKPNFLSWFGVAKLGVGISGGAVWQRPQAKLTLEALLAQCPSHLFPVKSFHFRDHLLNAG